LDNIFNNREDNREDLENEIFKDESVFYPEYVPDVINCRNNEIKEFKYLLEPIITNKKPNNILLYGSPGTGKTLSTKYVLENLVNYTTKARYLYINAIQDNTRFAIISKIANLFTLALPRRGLGVDEIIDRIKYSLKTSSFTPIIIIDEIDKLHSNDCSNLLYDLSRITSNSKYFCLVLITNYKDFILNLDPRTKSSLFLEQIKFNKYSSKQLKEIIKQRVEYGLSSKKVISDDLIDYIAGFASSRGGDARIAIDYLYKSAKKAEKEGLNKITKKIVVNSDIAKDIDSIKLNENFKYLTNKEKEVLKVLEDGLTTNALYLKLDISQRSIRRYLQNLEKLNLIRIENINASKGRSRKIYLNFNKDLLK
jgi:cell division control protein 6